MNYGLYLSASGMLTNSYRQDVLANNLANVSTVGFKPDVPTVASRPPEAREDLSPASTAQELLDRLGGGVLAGPQVINFAPGPLEQTGRELDVALTDATSFLSVQVRDPQTGQTAVQVTRDGRLAVDGAGYLVTVAGHKVLDAADQPLRVSPDVPVSILPDGRIQQNGADVGRMGVATVLNPQSLLKAGSNLFAFKAGDTRTVNTEPTLRVSALEASGTNAITTLMSIMAATKAATGNGKLIQYHDGLMDRAINTLGRVA